MHRPLHLDELVDSLSFLQTKHTKLQYQSKTIVQGGGIYGKLNSSLPVEVEEMKEEDSEAQLQEAIEHLMRKPLIEHQLVVKAIFAPKSCDLVVGVSNGAADIAASGMLVNDLLRRYADLLRDASKAPTSTEIAPIIDDLSNIFPSATRTSFLGWRAVKASMKEYTRMAKAIQVQSPLRLQLDQSPPSFFTIELSSELSSSLERKAIDNGVDMLSAFAAAVSLAARDKLFKLSVDRDQSIPVDLWINHDLRIDGFQPHFPNNTMTVAEVPSYHILSSGSSSSSRNVWEMAREIYDDVKRVISTDQLFDSYHFAPTASAVKVRSISSVPMAPFVFQEAHGLTIDPSVVEQLEIDDIRLAETATPGTCKLILSRFNHKLQLSFNFPVGAMNAAEAEVVTDAALDLLRCESPKMNRPDDEQD